MTGPEAITVLRARGRRLAKIVAPDGTIQDYDKPYRFDLSEGSRHESRQARTAPPPPRMPT
jgi:hypothetical protein